MRAITSIAARGAGPPATNFRVLADPWNVTLVRGWVFALCWLGALANPAHAGATPVGDATPGPSGSRSPGARAMRPGISQDGRLVVAGVPGAPAWWQTGWFLAGFAIVCVFGVGAVFARQQRAVLDRRLRQLDEQADANFRALIDLMPDLITVQRAGALIYVNLACRRLLGIDRPGGALAMAEIVDRVHADDRAELETVCRRVEQLAPERPTVLSELRLRGGDGTWRVCEGSAIRVEIGGAPTVVTTAHDMTERKRMRAKMLISDRMASLGTLAAGIAHEINNPLAYVTGNLEVIAETLEDAQASATTATRDELSAAISDARDGAERVRKIVQGLRSFTRSEDETRVPVDLGSVLDASIKLTGNEVRHQAQLVREAGATPTVLGDDGRLTQVFINLLINAAHAIPEGRRDDNRITVRTRTDDRGNAVVEIEDTGTGMPPEIQARVFDPFFTTKQVGEGTGLGLSICRSIISGLGGQIVIESPPADSVVGHGTVLRVILPPHGGLARASPSPARAPTAPTHRARRHRVLLVEDEPLVAQTVARLLRGEHDVTIAASGHEAISQIASGSRFDAIVSDVMMPNMTGIELRDVLARIAPDQAQRLIFLSGGAFSAQTRQRLEQIGAPQLAKPATAQDLRDLVLKVASYPSREQSAGTGS